MYEDRVVGSSRIQSYKTVPHMHVEKEGPLSIGYFSIKLLFSKVGKVAALDTAS